MQRYHISYERFVRMILYNPMICIYHMIYKYLINCMYDMILNIYAIQPGFLKFAPVYIASLPNSSSILNN